VGGAEEARYRQWAGEGATPDGRRRVAETIAKQFNVPEKLVNDLRGRKVAMVRSPPPSRSRSS